METSESLWDSTEGLCGNPNGNPYDDFALAEGDGAASTVSQLAEAWRSPNWRCKWTGPDVTTCDEEGEADLFCKTLLELDTLEECRKVRG